MSAVVPQALAVAPRFGPQWWRSGTRTRVWWAAVVLSIAISVPALLYDAGAPLAKLGPGLLALPLAKSSHIASARSVRCG